MTSIPTTQEAIDESLANLESALGQDSNLDDKAFLIVLSSVLGMVKKSLYRNNLENRLAVLIITYQGADRTGG